jgi:chromosome transmission fidelity protein 4
MATEDKNTLLPELIYAHGAGKGSFSFTKDGTYALTCGSDKRLCLYNVKKITSGDDEPAATMDFPGPLSAMAYSAAIDQVFVCCDDRFVTGVPIVDGETPSFGESSVALRLAATPGAVAASPSGAHCAASGDEGDISIVNLNDKSSISKLRGQKPSCTHLEYDPEGEFLASASSTGSVRIWQLPSNKELHKVELKGNLGDNERWQVGWHPSGDYLAVPGASTVKVLERGSWKTAYCIGEANEHAPEIALVAWSPNGLYLASVDLDSKITVWDATTQSLVRTVPVEDGIQALAWSPAGNRLGFFTTDGEIGICDNIVPGHMNPPASAVAKAPKGVAAKPAATTEPKQQEAAKAAPSVAAPQSSSKRVFAEEDDDDDDDEEEEGNAKGGAATTNPLIDDAASSDDDEFDSSDLAKIKEKYMNPSMDHVHAARSDEIESAAPAAPQILYAPETEVQEAFQPGETPRFQKRRFLTWNLTGSIVTRNEESFNAIDIEFSDQSKRGQKFTDHYGFQIAALNETGAVFASKAEDKTRSVVYFLPFQSYAHNSDITIDLPAGESATAVAIGAGWFGVSTSKNYLRILRHSGLQSLPLLVPGEILAMAGHGTMLAIVYNSAPPFTPSQGGSAVLSFSLYSTGTESNATGNGFIPKVLASGRLPLSGDIEANSEERTQLQWLGFSDQGVCMASDTNGVMFSLSPSDLNQWIPVLDAKTMLKSSTECYWPVGVTSSRLHYALCKGRTIAERVPRTRPKPLLGMVDLSVPTVNVRGQSTATEGQFLKVTMEVSQKHVLEALGVQPKETEGEKLRSAVALDRLSLKIMYAAIKEEQFPRALDLARQLQNIASYDTAIKMARSARNETLMENIFSMKQAKQEALWASEQPVAAPSIVQASHQVAQPDQNQQQEANSTAKPKSILQPSKSSPVVAKSNLFSMERKTVKSKRSLGARDSTTQKPSQKKLKTSANPWAKSSHASPQKGSMGVFERLGKLGKSPQGVENAFASKRLNRSSTFSKEARTKTKSKNALAH